MTAESARGFDNGRLDLMSESVRAANSKWSDVYKDIYRLGLTMRRPRPSRTLGRIHTWQQLSVLRITFSGLCQDSVAYIWLTKTKDFASRYGWSSAKESNVPVNRRTTTTIRLIFAGIMEIVFYFQNWREVLIPATKHVHFILRLTLWMSGREAVQRQAK